METLTKLLDEQIVVENETIEFKNKMTSTIPNLENNIQELKVNIEILTKINEFSQQCEILEKNYDSILKENEKLYESNIMLENLICKLKIEFNDKNESINANKRDIEKKISENKK